MNTLRAITVTRPESRSPGNRRRIGKEAYKTALRNAALAVALAAAATTAHAGVRASAVRTGAWTTSGPTQVFVPLNNAGATTLSFKLGSAGKKVLTYSASCAVGATFNDYLELDIYVNGVIVAPTTSLYDAFCTSNGLGREAAGPHTLASITVPIEGITGNNTVQIKVKGYSGSVLWLSDSALVIYD
jgi:hypothetical protein